MGMSLGFRLECRQTQRYVLRLGTEQKQSLKQLLQMLQTLREPEFPQAARGLAGMLAADELLKERSARGILIGGLAQAIWNQRRSPSGLESHKDVDVLVLDQAFALKEDFEGGIDWWLPYKRWITIKEHAVSADLQIKWFQNLNKVVLGFTIQDDHIPESFAPGLYLPGPDWVIKSLYVEAQTHRGSEDIDLDTESDIYQAFASRFKRRKIKTRVPQFLKRIFPRRICCSSYVDGLSLTDYLKLKGHVISKLREINRIRDSI